MHVSHLCTHATHAGVIGRRMKMEAFIPAIPEIVTKLSPSLEDGHRAAIAITTTGEHEYEQALVHLASWGKPAC